MVKFFNDIVQYGPPLIIAALVSWADSSDPSLRDGFLWIALLAFCGFSKTILENQYFFHMTRLGINVRAALMKLLYSKALRVNLATGLEFNLGAGQIIQLMNTDTEFLLQFGTCFIHN